AQACAAGCSRRAESKGEERSRTTCAVFNTARVADTVRWAHFLEAFQASTYFDFGLRLAQASAQYDIFF
ncbi:MAG: hypothetical protein EA364_00275, partial [Balneolaceae bacterium]